MSKFWVFLLAVGFLAPMSASAQQNGPTCGPREVLVRFLAENFSETRIGMGLSTLGALVELFGSKAGTWTILVTGPDGPTCSVAAGNSWNKFDELRKDKGKRT